jgi:hypothetical protein
MDNNSNPIELKLLSAALFPLAESTALENKQGIYKTICKRREKKAFFLLFEESSGNFTLIVL